MVIANNVLNEEIVSNVDGGYKKYLVHFFDSLPAMIHVLPCKMHKKLWLDWLDEYQMLNLVKIIF